MIKKLIEGVVSGKPVSDRDLGAFIAEYSELCGIKDTSQDYIDVAVMLVKNGNFNIIHAINKYIEIKGLLVTKISDKNGLLIDIKIEERNEKV